MDLTADERFRCATESGGLYSVRPCETPAQVRRVVRNLVRLHPKHFAFSAEVLLELAADTIEQSGGGVTEGLARS